MVLMRIEMMEKLKDSYVLFIIGNISKVHTDMFARLDEMSSYIKCKRYLSKN